MEENTKSGVTFAIIVLVVLHYVGVIGLHLDDYKELFQNLTPVNLLLSIGILAYFHNREIQDSSDHLVQILIDILEILSTQPAQTVLFFTK